MLSSSSTLSTRYVPGRGQQQVSVIFVHANIDHPPFAAICTVRSRSGTAKISRDPVKVYSQRLTVLQFHQPFRSAALSRALEVQTRTTHSSILRFSCICPRHTIAPWCTVASSSAWLSITPDCLKDNIPMREDLCQLRNSVFWHLG